MQIVFRKLLKKMNYLFYLVPPEEPEILDSQGRQVGLKIGPYKIGDNIFLKCRVRGGKIQLLLLPRQSL